MSQDTETPESAADADPTTPARTAASPESDPSVGLSAEELLSIPPRADNLAEELAARPPRAKLPRATLALSAGILIAAGFVGGVLVEKHFGGSGTGAARASSLASSFAAARGSGGG